MIQAPSATREISISTRFHWPDPLTPIEETTDYPRHQFFGKPNGTVPQLCTAPCAAACQTRSERDGVDGPPTQGRQSAIALESRFRKRQI